ncbi:MAG: energy transducer TonB [Acidobacteria bacterium]|jgi:periplasmic protein TonB|nr:energy transducer TonB [Acidobacteriota bacterium]
MARCGLQRRDHSPAAEAQVGQAGQDDNFGKGAYKVGTPGLRMPTVTRQSSPRYTPEAMRAKVEGIVELEAVVAADGTIEASRVVKGLGHGLDEAAMDTVQSWEFKPGRLNDQPVRVMITLQMQFRLHH